MMALMMFQFSVIILSSLGLNYLINSIRKKKIERGMNLWHDMLDWLGGDPFEVGSKEEIISFYQEKGLSLININDCGRKMGCNEYLFESKL